MIYVWNGYGTLSPAKERYSKIVRSSVWHGQTLQLRLRRTSRNPDISQALGNYLEDEQHKTTMHAIHIGWVRLFNEISLRSSSKIYVCFLKIKLVVFFVNRLNPGFPVNFLVNNSPQWCW